MMRKCFFLFFLVVFVLFSCEEKGMSLKLLKVTEHSSVKVSDSALIKLFKSKKNIDIEISYTLSPTYAHDQLEEKKVDFVITPNNSRPVEKDFRIIVPLLPRILMILTNKDTEDSDIKEVFENGIVYFEDRSRLDTLIFEKLHYSFDVDNHNVDARRIEDLDVKIKSDSLLVYAGLTHFNNEMVKKLANNGWYFFSLDNLDYYKKGSRVEGYTMMNSSAHSFVLPRSIFKGKPVRPIYTIAMSDVLITRSDVDKELVYDIAEAIVEFKSELIRMNSVYNLLDFNFDKHTMSFPIHKGAMSFFNKDEPPVWSKYVKMIWPLISISVVLFGILVSFRNRYKKRIKQNIEMYYNSLLDIRGKSETTKDTDSLIGILKDLKELRSQAMKSLADKKLDSGESFNIFLALYSDTKNELIDELRDIRAKNQEDKT